MRWARNNPQSIFLLGIVGLPLVVALGFAVLRSLVPRRVLPYIPWWSRDLRSVLRAAKRLPRNE